MTGDTGKATLVSVVALDGLDESAVLSLVVGVAGGLDAALAAAILDSARERDIPVRAVDQLRDTTRKGVAGSVEGHAVVVGNAALFAGLGLSLDSFGEWPDRLRRRGEHVLLVATDGRAAAFFGVANAPAKDTDSDDKEDSMQHSVAISEFPTATNGLPVARPAAAQRGTQDTILFHQKPDHVLLTSSTSPRGPRGVFKERPRK